jgi:hypothetical protein
MSDAILQPVQFADDILAVVLVPIRGTSQVSCNGVPLEPGLHPMRHGDRLDISGQTYWVASQATVDRVAYDPAAHGEDVFCFMTKARIKPGDAIAICPGTGGRRCGVIYTARAWDMAMTPDSTISCPSCGYHAGQDVWSPQPRAERKSFDELLPRRL